MTWCLTQKQQSVIGWHHHLVWGSLHTCQCYRVWPLIPRTLRCTVPVPVCSHSPVVCSSHYYIMVFTNWRHLSLSSSRLCVFNTCTACWNTPTHAVALSYTYLCSRTSFSSLWKDVGVFTISALGCQGEKKPKTYRGFSIFCPSCSLIPYLFLTYSSSHILYSISIFMYFIHMYNWVVLVWITCFFGGMYHLATGEFCKDADEELVCTE